MLSAYANILICSLALVVAVEALMGSAVGAVENGEREAW